MIEVYTDGSSRKAEQWIGAIAFAVYDGECARYQCVQQVMPGTNNGSELIAVMKALHYCHNTYPDRQLHIYTDSQYVLNGDKRSASNPLKTNTHLWNLYYKLKENMNFSISHVKAHDKNERNNHVDNLARQELRAYFNAKKNS